MNTGEPSNAENLSQIFPLNQEILPVLPQSANQLDNDHASESSLAPKPARYDSIVQLPAELLVEIFDMCSPPGDGFLSDATTPEQEVERLAKSYLLQLSQVCSRWHILVMGTPMLWSTIVVDTTLWSDCAKSSMTLLDLLAISLDRGEVIRSAFGSPSKMKNPSHAPRWQEAHFWTGFVSFQSIHAACGNLPLLEKLEISQNDDWSDFDVFAVAPRLTNFTVTGWGAQVPTVPWGQIQSFRYQSFEANPDLLANALTLLRDDFPAHARCDLTLPVFDIVHPIDLPTVVSNASHFVLTLEVNFLEEPPIDVLGAILGCLTLPALNTLELMAKLDVPPLAWHQAHFLAFASRSSLRANLTALEITRTTIDDDELISCLSVLPLLEQLIVTDCEEIPHALVTDSLLRRLAWTADLSCLVPRLSFLCITSLLSFSDDVYWDFVLSRLAPARWEGLILEAKIYWLPGRSRELSEEFLLKGRALDAEGELSFTARSDPARYMMQEEDV
ncbi:hypothetical protein B0H19DRAFT_1365170 [Mycena capillaripes]|nr:hypothetical protein B0H19DRAFT_1365170 [Mycena capillaripes]